MNRRVLALLLAGTGAASAARRRRPASPKAPGRDQLLESLKKADLDFAEATRTRRLDGWMSVFAEDATGFPTGKPMITGFEELRKHYAGMFEDPNFEITWKPVKVDVAASGDIGYTIGTAQFRTRNKDGSPMIRPGKYLTVWKKQKDGSWKVVADLGN